MKPFAQATNSALAVAGDSAPLKLAASVPTTGDFEAAEACAGLLLETAPLIMGTVRRLISTCDASTLTVQQFRALVYLQRHGKASLSETAQFLNLALPSTSKLVDQLVRQGLLSRDNDAVDRRRMVLCMTSSGQARLVEAQGEIRRRLAGALGSLDRGQLAALNMALMRMRQSLAVPASGRVRKTHRIVEAAK